MSKKSALEFLEEEEKPAAESFLEEESKKEPVSAEDFLSSDDNVPRGTFFPTTIDKIKDVAAKSPDALLSTLKGQIPKVDMDETTKGVVRGVPGVAKETISDLALKPDVRNAAVAYEAAGALKGLSMGYADPLTPLLEKTPLKNAPISKEVASGAGEFAGAIAPISVISKLVGTGLKATKLAANARPVIQALTNSAVTGAAFGAARQVENPDDPQLAQRAENALNDAAIFVGLHGAGELVGHAGEIGATLKNFVKERVLTKGVKVPFTAEDARGFFTYAKGNLDPEIYETLLKMPKETVVNMAKKAMAGDAVFFEKRVPRFGGRAKPGANTPQTPAPGAQGGPLVPVSGAEGGKPPPSFTFAPETVGEKGFGYFKTKFPTVSSALEGKPMPLAPDEARTALQKAAATGEEVLLRGGTPEDANLAALKSFRDNAAPIMGANRAKALQAKEAQDHQDLMDAIQSMEIAPYEMTLPEYQKTLAKGTPPEVAAAQHKEIVARALQNFDFVPSRVVESYPDLISQSQLSEAKSATEHLLTKEISPLKIKKREIEAYAQDLHKQALETWESKTTDLERFIRDQGGISPYKPNPVTGRMEEVEEYKNIPVRLRGQVPYDVMIDRAKEAGILGADAAYGDLYEQLNNLPKKGPKPQLKDFMDEAKRNIEYELSAQYSAEPANAGQLRAREAALRVLSANKLTDQVVIKIVDQIIADEVAFKSGRPEAKLEDNEILGATYPGTDRLQSLIELASGATEATGRHEAFHAVTNIVLDDSAQKIILDKYGDMETAADAFGRYRETGQETDGVIRRIFEKIKQFLKRLKNYFEFKNFKTADDLFSAIDKGQVGKPKSPFSPIRKTAEARKSPAYAASEAKALEEKALMKFGETKDVDKAAFILEDGRMIEKTPRGLREHRDVAQIYGETSRENDTLRLHDFIEKTKAVRMNHYEMPGGTHVTIETHGPISSAQYEQIDAYLTQHPVKEAAFELVDAEGYSLRDRLVPRPDGSDAIRFFNGSAQYSAKPKDDANQMSLFDRNFQPTKEAKASESPKPAPAKPLTLEVKKPAKPAAGEVADVGEELWYNRRNLTKGITWDKVKDLNPTLKVREVVKTKVWERPDYEDLVDGGMQPLTAHLVKQIYDSIAKAPAVRGTATDEQMKLYMDGVEKVRDAVFAWAKDAEKQKAFFGRLSDSAGRSLMYTVAANDLSMLDAVFPKGPDSRSRFRDNPEMNRLAILLGGDKLVKALQPGHRAAYDASKSIKEGWPAKREAWQMQFKVVEEKRGSSPSEFYVVRKATGRIMAANFKTKQEAAEHAKTLVEARKGSTQPERRTLDRWERQGPARRETGEDIEPQRLMDTFGFRGVNYGNWVKDQERQEFTNAAYDALSDLAEILRVPPKALSLNGLLGIAFGAQGRGGRAAAHFVPGLNEINLTKTAGAGALAHEWGHALDHYFGVQAGEKIQKSQRPYLTHHAELLKPEDAPMLRPEILKAFEDIVVAMKKRVETQEEADARIAKQDEANQKRLDSWLTAIRDRFKNGTPAEKLDGVLKQYEEIANRIRKGDSGSGYLPNGRTPMNAIPPAVAQIRDLYRSATDSKLDAHYIQGLSSNAQHIAYTLKDENRVRRHTPVTVDTQYRAEASKLDKDKGGKSYWSTETELLARAFESYILDRLKIAGQRNDYLTAPQSENDYTFPQGVDRDKITKAFDTLIAGLKTKPTDRGIALYSATPKKISKKEINKFLTPSRAKDPKIYTERAALKISLQRQAKASVAMERETINKLTAIKSDVVQAMKELLPETERGVFIGKLVEANTPKQVENLIKQIRIRAQNVMSRGARTLTEKQALNVFLERESSVIKEAIRQTEQKFVQTKKALIDEIERRLPPQERGQFLRIINDAKSTRDMVTATTRIDEAVDVFQRKTIIHSIKREIQRIQASKNIAIDYKAKVAQVVGEIVFQKPRTSTLKKLSELRTMLIRESEKGNDVRLPKYVIEKLRILSGRPLSEFKTSELEDIQTQLRTLADLGKTKLRVRDEIDFLNKQKDIADLEHDTVAYEKRALTRPLPGETLPASSAIGNFYKSAVNRAINTQEAITPPDVFFDMLDGNKNYTGSNTRIFKGRFDSRFGEYLNELSSIKKEAVLKAKGLNRKSMERIGAYAISVQDGGIEKLYNNYGISPNTTDPEKLALKARLDQKIKGINLTPQEMEFYRYMRTRLDAIRPRIAETMKNVYNADLGEVKNYFPFVTDHTLMSEDAVQNSLLSQMIGLSKTTPKGFTIERTGPGDQKVVLNAFDVFTRHMDDALYLVNTGETVKYLGELANSQEYKKLAGEEGAQWVREWVDVLAKKGGGLGGQQIHFLDKLRVNVGVATLGFKLSSAMIQITPIGEGATLIGNYAFKGAVRYGMSDEWRNFINKYMPEVRERGGDDPAYKEFISEHGLRAKVGEASYWMLKNLDQLSAGSVALGAYEKYLADRGLRMDSQAPNREALIEAQRIVRRTQSSSFFKDAPLALSRGKLTGSRSFDRALFQFQNFVLTNYSLLRHEGFRAGIAGGNVAQGMGVYMWSFLMALAGAGIRVGTKEVVDMMTGRKDKKKDPAAEKILKNAIKDMLTRVPFVSQAMSVVSYGSFPVPALDFLLKTGEGLKTATTGKKKSTRYRGLARAAFAMARPLGIPGSLQAQEIYQSLVSSKKRNR